MAQATTATLEWRRFRGLFGMQQRRRGLRWHGSVDQLADAWTAAGATITYEPLENGAASSRIVGTFRTWGSPWTDVVERHDSHLLVPALASAISRHGHAVMLYDYDFTSDRFQHTLFATGTPAESWSTATERGHDVRRYLDARYRALQMRDWGVTLADLDALALPFPPTLMVEAFFLSLEPEDRCRLWAADHA